MINEFNNEVCARFYWQVNDEIAAGKQFEYLYERATMVALFYSTYCFFFL